MIKEDQMVVTSQDGEEQVCDILFTHEHNGKNYVVFEFVDSGEVSAAIYKPGEGEDEGEFFDIETDEEWDMLDRVLQAFYDELEQEEDEDEEDSES
ncbi:MAG: hypothetical protein CVV61_07610 [Tenericutes bacterium HGW-Tenericutes-6]|jgi:uncharacterized protein YrzB (UPF0473 family)|nr:MAG: hypothetical protein CVV61_07610 [Tenericutes bacterium HGW-Tenericutes-6]